MATLDQIADGVVVTDLDGHFLLFNPAAERILGLGAVDSGPATWSAHYGLFLPDKITPFPPENLPLYRAMKGEPVETTEIFLKNESMTKGVWLSVRATPLRGDNGQVVGGTAVFRDITDRKDVEEQLVASKELAEAAAVDKGRFLAAMSHDIRSPLNTIIGMLEVVLSSSLENAQREYLSVVRESSESLLSLIDDLLDFSRIEAGRLSLAHVPYSLREVIGDTMKSLGFQAHTKGLELASRIDPDVPDGLIGDPNRLRQLLGNLITNAIKYTDRGEVVLRVECASREGSRADLRVSVRDTGVGISPEHQEQIFAPYNRGDPRVTKGRTGSGLGLAIAAKIVELMGGNLSLESSPGEGSTFHFTAPFSLQARPQVVFPAEWKTIQGWNVLVVDDHETCRDILTGMFEAWGFHTTTASGATAGLAAVEQGLPDLVLIDAEMTKLDGFWLAEQLGARFPGVARIMMLSSSIRLGDLARCESLGVNAFVRKPIKHSELQEALLLAGSGHKPGPPLRQGNLVSSQPRRILLAEDSLVNQKLAGAILTGWGHLVLFANNGKEAVAIAESRPVDLILMDVEMPEMDGLEASRSIRQWEQEQGADHTPIFALTAHVLDADQEQCREAGMDEVVVKPFDIEDLFAKIEAVPRRRDDPIPSAPTHGG